MGGTERRKTGESHQGKVTADCLVQSIVEPAKKLQDGMPVPLTHPRFGLERNSSDMDVFHSQARRVSEANATHPPRPPARDASVGFGTTGK